VYEPTVELSGHLGSDPELRYTPNGTPVCDLRVAVTPRRKVGEEWHDLETVWFSVSCWKQLAENVAASLHKGDRVLVGGRLGQQSYSRGDGSAATKLVVDATTVGADLSRAEVKVKRPVREGAAAEVWADKFGAPPPDGPVVAETADEGEEQAA
jgi:single-strand DNA-binding protein